jgi:hypothetical protein
VDLYAFQFDGDTILLRADSERAAVCRAYHEVVTEYGLDPDRLQRMGWPGDQDFSILGDIDEPVILEGAG